MPSSGMGIFDSPSPSLVRIERKLDLIIKHLGIEGVDMVSPQVRAAITAGNKIQAIKQYREETGVGLREAKEFIESEMR